MKKQPRFIPVKDEYQPYSDCEHPLCETIHRKWRVRRGYEWVCEKPIAPRIEWVIVDTETGERASIPALSDAYFLKRDAQRDIDRYLAHEQRKVEHAVPTHLAQMLNGF